MNSKRSMKPFSLSYSSSGCLDVSQPAVTFPASGFWGSPSLRGSAPEIRDDTGFDIHAFQSWAVGRRLPRGDARSGLRPQPE